MSLIYFTGFQTGLEQFVGILEDENNQSINTSNKEAELYCASNTSAACKIEYSLDSPSQYITIGFNFKISSLVDTIKFVEFYPHCIVVFNFNSNEVKILDYKNENEIYSTTYNFSNFLNWRFLEFKTKVQASSGCFIEIYDTRDEISTEILSISGIDFYNDNFNEEFEKISIINQKQQNEDTYFYIDNVYIKNDINEYLKEILVVNYKVNEIETNGKWSSTDIIKIQNKDNEYIIPITSGSNIKNDFNISLDYSLILAFQDIIYISKFSEDGIFPHIKIQSLFGNNNEIINEKIIDYNEIDLEEKLYTSNIINNINFSAIPPSAFHLNLIAL